MAQYNANCCVSLFLEDFIMKHLMTAFFLPMPQMMEAMQKILGEHLPNVLGHLNRKLPDTKFLLGDKVSKHDIQIIQFFTKMYHIGEGDKMAMFKTSV